MNLISLEDLFNTYNFETPDYQRGYAWLEENVIDFWEDLSRIDAGNPQHFMGSLILEIRSADTQKTALVVDGQQRLTTVVLLSSAIAETLDKQGKTKEANTFRSKFLGSAESPKFRYSKTHDSWPYLAAHVYRDPAYIARAADHDSAYAHNIDAALLLLRKQVGKLTEEQINLLIGKMNSKVVFSVVEVNPAVFNIHVAFETINHRGKQLTKLELLKNRLIYVASMLPAPVSESAKDWTSVKEELRDQINSAWTDIYSWLGRGGKDALDDEEFLRNHAIIYFEVDTGEGQWLDTLLFKTEFSANRAISGEITVESITTYLNSLRLSVVLWSHIKRPRNMPPEQFLWLNRINHVHRPLFDPLLLAAYVRMIGSEPALAMDLRKSSAQDDALISVLIEIERFNVLVFLVSGRRSHTGRKDFSRLAHQLYAGQNKYSGTANQALDYLRRLIHACVDNTDPNNASGYADSEFQWAGWLDLNAFKNTIVQSLRLNEGYYDHEWTRVVLFEYEESRRALAKGGAALVQWDRVSMDTIEHIYPQDDTLWRDLTDKLGGGRRKAVVNSYKHSLGNLLLLTRSKNSSLQNIPYAGQDEKRAKRPRFAKGSFSETEVASQFKRWGKLSIEQRGKALLQFSENRWGFSFQQHGIKYKELLVLS